MVLDIVAAFFFIRVAIALIASGYAGWVDLKTTDVPDIAPWIMGVSGVALNGLLSLITGDYTHILWSVSVGLGFAAFGFGYYYAKGWGGGDAKILTGIGFLIPNFALNSVLPYPVAFLINVFLVGAIYSIIFSFYVASKNPKIWKMFKKDLSQKSTLALVIFVPILASLVPVTIALANDLPLSNMINASAVAFMIVLGTMLWWRFAKIVENKIFMYRIPVSKLKEGDVIANDVRVGKKIIKAGLIEGLTRSQVAQIRKYHSTVWVKEGVRFAPVFTLTIIVTLLGFSLF